MLIGVLAAMSNSPPLTPDTVIRHSLVLKGTFKFTCGAPFFFLESCVVVPQHLNFSKGLTHDLDSDPLFLAVR